MAAEGLAFVASVVLARLISPTEFGRAAIAGIVIAFALGTAGQGIGSPLVQMRALRSDHVRAALLLSVLWGGAAAALTVGVSFLVRPIFDHRTIELIRLAAPAFALAAVGAVPQALTQRQLDFRRLSIAEVIAALAAISTSISLALVGFDGEALVLGLLAATATTSGVLLIQTRPGWPGWRGAEMREIAAFGLPASMASLSYTASRNVDYAIVGARLGPTITGFYWRGYQLGVEYQSKISGILLRVAFPVFSRAEDLDAIRDLRARIVRLHAVLLFPLLGTLIVIAPVFVPWLYGERWAPAGTLTQLLAVGGMAVAIATGTGPLMLATGHPKALRNYNLTSVVLFGCMVYLVAPYGIVTVCVAVAAYRVCSLVATQYFLVQRLVGIPLRETLLSDAAPAATSTAGLVAVGVPLLAVLTRIGAATWLALGVTSIVCLVTYGVILTMLFPGARSDFDRLAARLLPHRRGTSTT